MNNKQRYFLVASLAIFAVVMTSQDIIDCFRDRHYIKIQIDNSGRVLWIRNPTGVTITNLHFEVVK